VKRRVCWPTSNHLGSCRCGNVGFQVERPAVLAAAESEGVYLLHGAAKRPMRDTVERNKLRRDARDARSNSNQRRAGKADPEASSESEGKGAGAASQQTSSVRSRT